MTTASTLEPSKPEEKSTEHDPPSETTPVEPYSIFDKRQKAVIVFLVSTAATFSGFASNAYFPAIPTIARDLSVSTELINLTITSYLVFQGLAPSLWSPLSDVKGRRVAYICCFVIFIGACVGLGLTQNYATLVVLRCLQSTGSASTITIGSGVIGDITSRAERGGYMGVYQGMFLAPVAIGPVIGGALSGALGWRSIFWFIVIYCSIFLVALIFLLPETLRAKVGNGSHLPSALLLRWPLPLYQKTTKVDWTSSPTSTLPPKKHVNIFGPFRILISKQATPVILFLSIQFAVWQMSISALSALFEARYNLSQSQIGLVFLANGFGSIIGTLTTGKILNIDIRKTQQKLSEKQAADGEINTAPIDFNDPCFPLERARLRLMPPFTLIQAIALLVFGWTVEYSGRVPLAVPIVSTFFIGGFAVSMQSAGKHFLPIPPFTAPSFSDHAS